MNTKNKLAIVSILVSLVFFSFTSCTERIDIDLDNTYARTVIFGQITTDTTAHKVAVTKTGDFFKNTPPQGISGASVSIFDGENNFMLTEDINEPGIYYTEPNVFGVPGRTYTLYVDNVDLLDDGVFQSYQASTELVPVANPDSIKVVYRPTWQGWVVEAYAQDPPETKDFYKFLVSRNGESLSDSLRNIIITDDAFFNGSYTNGVVVHFFNGEESLSLGDTITTAFCGITHDYYVYLIEAQVTARPSVPLFSGPPANPRTNFSNNALGYFSAFSVARATAYVGAN